MLGLCVVLVCLKVALANQPWPFTVLDNYVEDFKSEVENVMEAASNYQFREESFDFKQYEENEHVAAKHADHFDFIVIGGGTSGSVLASRLSEVPEWRVLLLEAGGVENDATKIPKNWDMLKNTPFNWGYKTTPQNYSCLAMENHKCVIPTGRVLGGTSAINSMVYTRGNARDYDLWADLGNKGWCFSDVLPVYKKIEDAQIAHFDKKYHHLGGLQRLQNPQHSTYLADHAIQAGHELGLHLVDYNGKQQLGMAVPQLTTNCGKRSSVADSYLAHAGKRENLIVKPLSQVLKILVSPHTKEAQGVQYLHDGHLFVAKADKEVIVSAGALNTPKILLLSGIGPKEDCERLHIENVIDLKVGHNLKIRPSFVGLDFVYHEEPKIAHDESDHLLEYLKNGKGPMASPGIEALAYIKSGKDKTHPADYPDVELQFWSQPKDSVKIVVTLNHPKSTGFVKLHDADPLHQPLIEPHLLMDEDEYDFHTILAGINDAIKLSHTEAFKKLGLKINHKPVHGCEDVEFGTEYYWKCAIKYLVVPTGDASGTARMGPAADDEAVVDNTLKVRGMHKLRVADASVIPVTITGNLMGPSIMIGEKAAHLIIDDWTE